LIKDYCKSGNIPFHGVKTHFGEILVGVFLLKVIAGILGILALVLPIFIPLGFIYGLIF